MDPEKIDTLGEEVDWLHDVLDSPDAPYDTRRAIIRGRVAQLAVEGVAVGDVIGRLESEHGIEVTDGVAHWSDLRQLLAKIASEADDPRVAQAS